MLWITRTHPIVSFYVVVQAYEEDVDATLDVAGIVGKASASVVAEALEEEKMLSASPVVVGIVGKASAFVVMEAPGVLIILSNAAQGTIGIVGENAVSVIAYHRERWG